uniref:Innexin n=1 Tax=Toxocara canis TaxID=6265 RepID=A0A183V129_TOXCA
LRFVNAIHPFGFAVDSRAHFVFHCFKKCKFSLQDVVASLHSYFTFNMLIAFAILLSFKHFGGRPMECMIPPGFNGAWEQYTENYCWAQDTYFVPPRMFVEHVSPEDRRESRISYYQWMPFFLLFQAACFKLPTFIWKYLAGHSGMKVGEILRLVTDPTNSVIDVKKANIKALCIHLQGALHFHSRVKKKKMLPHKILRCLNVRYSSYYVAAVYMVAKLAFFFNVCFQLHLLSRYLLPQFENDFGLEGWSQLIWPTENYSSWHNSGLFPRVTLCDFEVREMGNIQRHTIQCVLVVNIFTEKIFILLWSWFAVLAAVTAISFISWLYFLSGPRFKEHFILNHLEMSEEPFDKYDQENKEAVERFIERYLGTDGIFILRMIAANADIVFTTELIAALWQSHYSFEQQRKAMHQMEMVWPQHEQRLESALMEEAEMMLELDVPDANLLRKRSMFQDSSFKSPPGSLYRRIQQAFLPPESMKGSGLRSPKLTYYGGSPPDSIMTGSIGAPRGSIVSISSLGKLRRRRSLESLKVESERVKKFADSSSDEDEKDDEKRGEVPSRKSSRVKFYP